MSDDKSEQDKAKEQAQADGTTDKVTVQGPQFPHRGAQVILSGQAQAAARGGMGGDIEANTLAKQALEADGTVADGSTPDGSTRTGKPAPDVVVTQEAKPSGEMPAEPGSTRVEVQDPGQADDSGGKTPPPSQPTPPAPPLPGTDEADKADEESSSSSKRKR